MGAACSMGWIGDITLLIIVGCIMVELWPPSVPLVAAGAHTGLLAWLESILELSK